MKYTVETTERFEKEFKRLDRYTQRMLKSWIEKNLVGCENPRAKGKGLTANRSGQWRYRIGDYRLICLIQDNELVILALTVGHRSDVYKNWTGSADTRFPLICLLGSRSIFNRLPRKSEFRYGILRFLR